MKYSLTLRDRAVAEMQQAYHWYEAQRQGLGEDFIATVNEYLEPIIKNPYIFRTTYRNFKEAWIKKYPYLIVYFIDDKRNKIVVVSVFHTSRNPKKKYT